jgi:ribosomal protein S18 acetylase RimI-like enzyme
MMDFNALSLPAGLHVRPSTPSDQPFLELLYKSTRTDLDLITADNDFIEELKGSQFAAQTASYEEQFPNAMYFVIQHHDQKVGRVILDFGSTEILVVDISFVPEARNKGLGSGVMRSFMHVSDQIRTPLKLSVLQENIAAKAFYSQLGFIHDEHRYPRDYLVYYPSTQATRVTA